MSEMMNNRGTCPACFNVFQLAMVQGQIVMGKHGWHEEGGRQVGVYGQATHQGQCFGVNLPPFELSPTGTEQYLSQVIWPSVLGWTNAFAKLATFPLLMVQTKHGIISLTVADHGYAREHKARVDEAERAIQTLKSLGTELTSKIATWTLQPILEGSSAAPVVHFRNDGARLPYCGTRSRGVRHTSNKDSVTCSRCLKAMAAYQKLVDERAALEADVATLTAHLRTSGAQTKGEIKKALGWDTKRVNKAVDQAERPWRDGMVQPGTIRGEYQDKGPEKFMAV